MTEYIKEIKNSAKRGGISQLNSYNLQRTGILNVISVGHSEGKKSFKKILGRQQGTNNKIHNITNGNVSIWTAQYGSHVDILVLN